MTRLISKACALCLAALPMQAHAAAHTDAPTLQTDEDTTSAGLKIKLEPVYISSYQVGTAQAQGFRVFSVIHQGKKQYFLIEIEEQGYATVNDAITTEQVKAAIKASGNPSAGGVGASRTISIGSNDTRTVGGDRGGSDDGGRGEDTKR